MFPDADIVERRLRQLERLPWPVPASIIMSMTEADFDALDMAQSRDEWWHVLNGIVIRVNDNEKATVLKVKAFGGEQGAKEHDPASWR